MYQLIACGDNHAPGNLWVFLTYGLRDVGGSLINEFKIAECCVVGDPTRYKLGLLKAIRLGNDLFTELNHILYIQRPISACEFRHLFDLDR